MNSKNDTTHEKLVRMIAQHIRKHGKDSVNMQLIEAMLPRAKGDKVLSETGEVIITEADVTQAIEEARKRVGDDLAQLLEGKPA